MKSKKFLKFFIFSFFGFQIYVPSFSADDVPSYTEIPYYIKQLEQSSLEDQRLENLKKIHDAVVYADLLNKKTVKSMEPMIDRILKLMDSNLDRPYVDGKSFYLASAVDYFEKQKMRPLVEIPQSDWMELQSQIGQQKKLSTYPDKILLHENGKAIEVAKNTKIHEAVISRDAKKIAYFRTSEDESRKAEIWVVNLLNKKQKRIAVVPSCYTLLFSEDGDVIYFQSKPKNQGEESLVFRVSSNGGRPKPFTSASLLQTLVSKGPYRGSLVVYRHTPHHWGVSDQECPYAISTRGREIGRIKNAPCK